MRNSVTDCIETYLGWAALCFVHFATQSCTVLSFRHIGQLVDGIKSNADVQFRIRGPKLDRISWVESILVPSQYLETGPVVDAVWL